MVLFRVEVKVCMFVGPLRLVRQNKLSKRYSQIQMQLCKTIRLPPSPFLFAMSSGEIIGTCHTRKLPLPLKLLPTQLLH